MKLDSRTGLQSTLSLRHMISQAWWGWEGINCLALLLLWSVSERGVFLWGIGMAEARCDSSRLPYRPLGPWILLPAWRPWTCCFQQSQDRYGRCRSRRNQNP